MATKLKRMTPSARSGMLTYGLVILAYAVLEGLLSGGLLSSSMKGLLVPICAYVVMAISLNLTVGVMPINWNRLRITHLGRLSKKTISGTVNFPIRFIYIKSTEATLVLATEQE